MGIKYPFGESPKYPPRDWTCPRCTHYHSKPHYALPGQIDYSLEPEEVGRVKWGREEKFSGCDSKEMLGKIPAKIVKLFKKKSTGDQNKKNGNQRPIFCPHCGWEDTIICITKRSSRKRAI